MKLKLIEIKDEARATKSFVFKPEKNINWQSGQYIYITLSKLNYPDDRGSTRHFTISYSPTEGTNIRVTTRIREESGFKKTLAALPIGSEVSGEGPEGTFVFDEKETGPNLFIAGGIGITVFRSYIKYAIDKNLNTQMYLIYTNSDAEYVFGEELLTWQKQYDFLKIAFIDSSKLGHLDSNMLTKFINGWALNKEKLNVWVSGSPEFINSVHDSLDQVGVSPSNIRSEKFTGY